MQPTLFENERARQPRRVLMHVIDAGGGCGDEPGTHEVVMQCGKCGYETGWITVRTVTEGRRGRPCPKCNQENSNGDR